MEQYILVCEDCIEGIFSAVYQAWECRLPRERIMIQAGETGNYFLFAEYHNVVTDFEKAARVAGTIRRRFGEEVYECICQAACSDSRDKGQAIFRTIEKGLRPGRRHPLMDELSDLDISRVFALSRAAFNESRHLLGFIRFRELYNGVLLSVITPKHDVLALIAPHFADRLPSENWMIYDSGREKAAVHQAGTGWGLVKSKSLDPAMLDRISDREGEFQQLWIQFCRSISVKERENLKLQGQNLPKRFRKNIIEFNTL